MRRIKPVIIGAHPSLYKKMEEIRKAYEDQAGIRLSHMQLTDMISKKIRAPNKIDIFRRQNVYKRKIKKR